VTATGAAYCWGLNADGEVGDGTTADRPSPTAVQGGTPFAAVVTGGLHTLGLTPAGVAYGWGRDFNGQLGTGTTTDKLIPTAVREP
jgi:alpha-tubulin suppressor-like RCC1 family protein